MITNSSNNLTFDDLSYNSILYIITTIISFFYSGVYIISGVTLYDSCKIHLMFKFSAVFAKAHRQLSPTYVFALQTRVVKIERECQKEQDFFGQEK